MIEVLGPAGNATLSVAARPCLNLQPCGSFTLATPLSSHRLRLRAPVLPMWHSVAQQSPKAWSSWLHPSALTGCA